MSGYYGSNYSNSYDKHLEHLDKSPLGKLQQQYWTTKQQVIQKFGKKEDEFVVLSDAELDAKLDLFAALKTNSNDLLRIIECYQEKLCQLSLEEEEMARFLKEFSQYDKTRAGKMMSCVAKTQHFSSQQRMLLRVPLARLYNEVETFRYRAITDTFITVRKMENARTEYRGALLWMKNVSQELDPDTHKKLEKFRRVQAQVKQTKTKFDRNKNDVIQKVDLLLASRCNMYSHVLIHYQQSLINYWQKTSKAFSAVADAFKGYQYYEFNIIKDLVEPSKKLAGIDANKAKLNDDQAAKSDNLSFDFNDDIFNDDNASNSLTAATDTTDKNNNKSLIELSFDYKNDSPAPSAEQQQQNKSNNEEKDDQLIDIASSNVGQEVEEEDADKQPKYTEDSVNDLIEMMTNNDASKLNEQLKELEMLVKQKEEKSKSMNNQKDLMKTSELIGDELSINEKNLLSLTNDEFEREWESVFSTNKHSNGSQQPQQTSTASAVVSDDSLFSSFIGSDSPTKSTQASSLINLASPSQFLPSQLMTSLLKSGDQTQQQQQQPQSNNLLQSQNAQQQPKPAQNKPTATNKKNDLSSWYNLFADLDPLQNPDAIGSQNKNEEERNC